MFLLLARFDYHDQVAAAVFIVFSLTDTMDGQIARRQGTVSDLGKFLDPLADKLFVLSVLIVLVQEGLVAAWVVVVIFSRELLITLLRTAAAGQGGVITLALAESCTGGLLAALVTDLPGSSTYFIGGVVAYSNSAKEKLLGVAGKLIADHGAVSAEVAEAMADGARARFGTALAAGVTGIAGPDADGTEKPVGLTYIAVATPSRTSSQEFTFLGDRWANRREAAVEALKMLAESARSVAAGKSTVKSA